MAKHAGAAAMAAAMVWGGPVASAQTPPDELRLVVNVNSGQVRLVGNAADPAELTSYQIDSTAGSLVPGNWSSLTDQGFGGWLEISATSTSLAEVSFGAGSAIDAGGVSLGPVFQPGGTQDLTFLYGEAGETGGAGTIEYIPEPAAATMVLALPLALLRRSRRHISLRG